MFKTFIGKFTFFFWLIFLILNIPIYFFGTIYVKNILIKSEQDKISLMLETLKPIIAFDISFNQEKQLDELLSTVLKYKGIKKFTIIYGNGKTILKSKKSNKIEKLFTYTTYISDPFKKERRVSINLLYSNENINNLQNKILTIQFFIFIFTLILFYLFFIFIRRDLNALRTISKTLQEYSKHKTMKPIILKNKSKEINTIANVANEMTIHISQYLKELKSFNTELEKQVEEKIQKEKKQEKMIIHQSRQAAMGEMLESIAHQWRQPLNIIGLSVANLERQFMLNNINHDDFKEKLNIIALNINYMSNTIDDFRNFLNPNREMIDFDLKKSIQEVLTILDAELKINKIHYTIKADIVLGFHGVENEFKQVIFVLINNAKDAIVSRINEHKIDSGEILVSISHKDNKGVINIEDNGGGIKEDIMQSIFEPYFTTKFASQGTGIGLYIVKNIIESRMKGTLSVKNTKAGCSFTIILPIDNTNKDKNT